MKLNKKMFFASLLTLAVSSSSFASCYENYQEKRNQVDTFLENSNYKQVIVEAAALSVSTNIVVLAALSSTGGGGPTVSTIGGAGMVSAAFFADKYVELRTDDSVKEAFQKRALLDASLNILKEAHIGRGPHLAQALTVLNENVSTTISMKNLADTIVSQDNSQIYCMDERIMSPAGIITLATQDLKNQL